MLAYTAFDEPLASEIPLSPSGSDSRKGPMASSCQLSVDVIGAGRSVSDTLDVPPSPAISLNCNQRGEPHNEIPTAFALLSHSGRPLADVLAPKTVVPARVTLVV